jgi:adenylosuccinate synthase
METVQICTAYRDASGEALTELPYDLVSRTDCTPIYETLPGWNEDISAAQSLEDLPANARRYVERVAQLAGAPVVTVSVGAGREQTIVIDEVMARIRTVNSR